MISTQDETLKSARREIGRLDPQMIVMTEDFDNLNSNVTQEFGNLHSVSEHIDEELGTIEADTQTYAVTFEQSMADINQAIEDQKRSIPVLMLQEADRQAQVRDDFRREIAEYESAREQETASRQELMQTVNSTIAALRARDQASHDRAASLQIRDLRNDHGQDNNAIGLDLNDIEATLDTLEADAEADDSLTQVESTIRNIQANITALNSKIDQNQNHQDMIEQQQSSQQQSIETEGGAIQEHTQAQETFDEQLESYNTTYQERVSTEEERLQTMETQVGDSTEILTTLQGIVDVLSTNVEGAEQQFAQYSSPAAISEGFASPLSMRSSAFATITDVLPVPAAAKTMLRSFERRTPRRCSWVSGLDSTTSKNS